MYNSSFCGSKATTAEVLYFDLPTSSDLRIKLKCFIFSTALILLGGVEI